MRIFLVVFLLIGATACKLCSQIQIKAEYIGSSGYRDADNNKTGGKGDARILSGSAQIPFYMKMNENNRPTAWGMGISGTYTSLKNKNIPIELCPDEIFNAQIGLMHMRPISKNWSILASLGAGVYTTHTDFSKIRMKNVLGSGTLIFIWHLNKNLDLGIGPAVNTSFGYPMAFPAIYLNWALSGRYEVKVSMMNALEVSAGIHFNDKFKLAIVADMSGSLALEKINDKEMMFSHQYIITGLRPEFTFGRISIPITAGISAERTAYYQERTLKAFFKNMNKEYNPHFTIAPYFSAGLKYNF